MEPTPEQLNDTRELLVRCTKKAQEITDRLIEETDHPREAVTSAAISLCVLAESAGLTMHDLMGLIMLFKRKAEKSWSESGHEADE